MTIKLIADSTCDLPEDVLQRHNIRIVPLSISVGDRFRKDGVEITPQDIFEYVEQGGELCRTSAVNVAEYLQVYEEECPKYDAVLHFFISADMSSCYQNARVAAEEFDNIYLIDTRNLSSAMGLLVLDAAELAAAGTPAEDIYHEMLNRIQRLDASFILDTLAYLHKGGRCSSIAALASGLLKIKPSILVTDGHMHVGQKYRGRLDSVLPKYIKDRLGSGQQIDPRRIIIAHTFTEENLGLVETVKAYVAEIIALDEIYVTTAGGTISCHCGPNTLGLFFMRKPVE